jgi:ribonuclease-3
MQKEKISRQRKMQLEDLIAKLKLDELEGIQIKLSLLNQAFRHPSYCMEKNDIQNNHHLESNQRLEFLGDAVLGLITAQALYRKHPNASEGELTKLRAALVCERTLASAARQYQLGDYLLLGKGIALSGGARQPSILADTFEAVLGALFLCGASLQALEKYVFEAVHTAMNHIEEGLDADYKGQLQAWVQRTNERQLSYRILDEQGPDHQKIFLAGAFLDDEEIGRGRGFSKQEAQKQAAKLALHRLKQEETEKEQKS